MPSTAPRFVARIDSDCEQRTVDIGELGNFRFLEAHPAEQHDATERSNDSDHARAMRIIRVCDTSRLRHFLRARPMPV